MRLARLGAAVALIVVPVLAPTPSSAAPSPTPGTANDDAPIRVTVTSLLPRAPAPGGFFEVSGSLTNRGDKPIARLRVRLQLGERVQARDQLRRDDVDRPETFWGGIEVKPVLTDRKSVV